jgi:integrase
VRVVDFPDLIVSDVRKHLDWLPANAPLVFATSTVTPLSHSNFRTRVWLPALAAVGLEGIHLHDLRHTGNQLTANAGANLKELMVRMGHDSERSALIYLHSSAARQRALADAVGDAARAELAKSKKPRMPSYLAREWHETAARLLRMANDLRPDRDSNAGPTA